MKDNHITGAGLHYFAIHGHMLIFAGSGAIIIIIAAIILISYYSAFRLTHPRRIPPDLGTTVRQDFEEAVFKDSTGKLNLKGSYFNANSGKKTIILSHGYLQNRMQFGSLTLDFINGFLNMGYNVFTFDYRNSGLSEGTKTSVGYYEKEDLTGAISWVKKKGSSQIILWGVSMGAATSILAASENSDADGVIADCPFADLEIYLKRNLPIWSGLPSIPFNNIIIYFMKRITGTAANSVSPLNALSGLVPRPVLFIHSTDDRRIPVSDSRGMYEKYNHLAPGKAFIWDTHNAEHAQSYVRHPDEYMEKVASFLRTI